MTILLTGTLSTAWAEDHGAMPGMEHMNHSHGAHGMAHSGSGEGVIRKIDAAAGKVTLRHGELAGLDMPAMTMTFGVKDKAILKGFKAGDKVRFKVDRSDDGNMTVSSMSRLK
jgi:Cu/Ag efflux protein CusF